MRVVPVDKKLLYTCTWLLSQMKIVRPVVGQGCLPLSSTRSSPCSQQLALLTLFTATGKRIWPIISLIRTFHLSGMVFLLLWPKGSRVHCIRTLKKVKTIIIIIIREYGSTLYGCIQSVDWISGLDYWTGLVD